MEFIIEKAGKPGSGITLTRLDNQPFIITSPAIQVTPNSDGTVTIALEPPFEVTPKDPSEGWKLAP